MSNAPESCRVCDSESPFRFRGRLLEYDVAYYECPKCRYVQTETPFWLEQAYQSAINRSDTGILRRNQRNCRLVIRLLSAVNALDQNVVDFAGGYGILVRMLRDSGIQSLWHDIYCENLVARGFEVDIDWSAYLVTGFEVLEHLTHPTNELRDAFDRSQLALFSTSLMGSTIPSHDQWWYYGREHGQHIGFYRVETLQYLANKFEFHLNTDGKFFHLFSRDPIPSWKWSMILRTRGLAPLIGLMKLKSLVWSDHDRFAASVA